MEGVAPTLLFLLVAALIVAGAVWAWRRERERRRRFRAWAAEHGFRYDPGLRKQLLKSLSFLDRLRRGHSRRAYHVLEGAWQGRPALAFQFRYTTGSGKNQSTHWLEVFAIRLERRFPELVLHPENFLTRIAEAFGLPDVDFESVEFSNAFRVSCRDKKFAYDFCNTAMMEYLLRHRKTVLELEGDVLALFAVGTLQAEDLEPAFDHLTAIRERMPRYLFRPDAPLQSTP